MTSDAMQRFANRLAGDQGMKLLSLSIATVRSVAVGGIGHCRDPGTIGRAGYDVR